MSAPTRALPARLASRATRALAAQSLGRLQRMRLFEVGVDAAPALESKERHLVGLFREGGHAVFLESGTYKGDTVAVLAPLARRVVSVEIDPSLHAEAARRFAAEPHVEIVLGDSQVEIPRLVAEAGGPSLLFLDGHSSGTVAGAGDVVEPAPLILEDLARSGVPEGTTIVVDDLRLFGRAPGFPTLERLVAAARAACPGASISAAVDALVIRS